MRCVCARNTSGRPIDPLQQIGTVIMPHDRDPRTGRYQPERAHRLAHERQRRPKPRKLAGDARLREWVQTRLNVQDSPEQIAGRLKVDFPDDASMRVSARDDLSGDLSAVGRAAAPRDAQPSAQCTGGCADHGRHALRASTTAARSWTRWSIHDRPEEVEGRLVPGHHEGDLIMGSRVNRRSGRSSNALSGFVRLVHLPDGHPPIGRRAPSPTQGSQLAVSDAQDDDLGPGNEMPGIDEVASRDRDEDVLRRAILALAARHNENINGLLRQYFPKGTDLPRTRPTNSNRSPTSLNDRPRKRLGFRTPNEVMTSLIEQDINRGVATIP